MTVQWDVFISHASEDKEAVVRPLASKLRRLGLRVWLDESELKLGDSLSRKIDQGLALSSVGIVVLSQSFFAKNWPEYELRGLTAKAMSGDGRIIPVWHEVSQAEVVRFSPTLADTLGANTNESLDHLALRIVASVRPDLHQAILRKIAFAERVARGEQRDFPAESIHKGPIRHASFPSNIVNRIDLIRYALLGAWDQTRRDWMEGFQRDAHPSSEIEIWENIEARVTRAALDHDLSPAGKRAIMLALLAASLGNNQAAAETMAEEFGEKAPEIFESMKYDMSIFMSPTDEDRRLQEEMNVDLEAMAGPEVAIDISYIDEIVAQMLNSEDH